MAEEVEKTSLLRFGVFELDSRTGELRKSGKLVRLAPQPSRLLTLLASKPGELVTREEIRRELWGDGRVVDFEQGLSFVVKKVRAALGDSSHSPRYIDTLPRRGYRFIAPVTVGSASEPLPGADTVAPLNPAVSVRFVGRRFWPAVAALAAIAMFLVAYGVETVRHRVFKAPSAPIHSVAVLPLESLSHGKGSAEFADGMTDELITDLSDITSLRVIAPTSAMAYKGSGKPLEQIARELHVDAVVQGSVEQAGHQVRINARVVDVSTRRVLWAASYERDAQDVLGLQSDVAKTIAKKIRVRLTPLDIRRLKASRAVNPAAYDAYQRGRYLIDQRLGHEARLSTQYFRKAIAIDPGYATAYAGLALSFVSQTFLGAARARAVMPEARAAARHALALNPDCGEAYTALGAIEFTYDYDWQAAGRNLRRGVTLSPSDPLAEILYTFYLLDVGRLQQAVAGARRAVTLDPVSFFANRNLAMMLFYDRRYDAALGQLQRTRQLRDVPGEVENWVIWAYEGEHRYGQAVRAALKAFAEAGVSAEELKDLRKAYAQGGWRGYWRANLDRLLRIEKRHPLSPFALGMAYAHIGDRDDAFRWLNRAVDRHSVWVGALAVNPQLDPLRSDPRFNALLRRIRLPQAHDGSTR